MAERHARQAIEAWSQYWVRWGLGVVGGLVVLAALVAGFSLSTMSAWLTPVVSAVALVLILAIAALRPRRVALLTRMELANKQALARAASDGPARGEGTATAPRQEPLAKRDLAVSYDRGRVLRRLGAHLGFACFFLAYVWLVPVTTGRLIFGFLSAWQLAVAVAGAVRVLRWGPPGRPIIRLDADGVHVPRYGYTLPWAELAEVRLITLRTRRLQRGRPAVIVGFMPADPEAMLRELRAKGMGRRLERESRLHGTALWLADRLLGQTADQIAAAASAWAPVPVNRY